MIEWIVALIVLIAFLGLMGCIEATSRKEDLWADEKEEGKGKV